METSISSCQTWDHVPSMEPWCKHGTMVQAWNHSPSMEPWSKHGTMFQAWNHVLNVGPCSKHGITYGTRLMHIVGVDSYFKSIWIYTAAPSVDINKKWIPSKPRAILRSYDSKECIFRKIKICWPGPSEISFYPNSFGGLPWEERPKYSTFWIQWGHKHDLYAPTF